MALDTGISPSPLSGVGRGRADRSRRDLSAPWRHVDVVLLVCTIALGTLGVLMVFSATRGATGPPETSFLVRQAAFSTIGVGVMVVATLIDYRRLRDWAWFFYGAALVALAVVISPLGTTAKGAQAWFSFGPFQVQPAEFAKVALIIALASLLALWAEDLNLRRVAVVLAVAAAPMLLILQQPDLGTVLVLVAITLGMLLIGGLKGRYILALFLIGLAGVIGVFNSGMLRQYQLDRFTAFIDPQADTQGITYNVNQSQIAISNGGLTGEGLFDGRQTQLEFVPEQQTDFIFTAVGEELGFVGAATVLALYGVVVWRMWRIAQISRDLLGSLICVGVLSMFTFQIFENIGMTMGIVPVTGIPLPLMSYGGSNTLAAFACIGLVLNVHMRRFR